MPKQLALMRASNSSRTGISVRAEAEGRKGAGQCIITEKTRYPMQIVAHERHMRMEA